jgi:hypothetical protein
VTALSRPEPKLPPEYYRTFGIASPQATHWRAATCVEVDCAAHTNGFQVTCDLRTQLGVNQARYIRDKAGRHFTHAFSDEGRVITFTFPPGQRCFIAHQLPLGRPALFVARNGDWRGSGRLPPERRRYDRPDQWADDFATHQDRLATAAARG